MLLTNPEDPEKAKPILDLLAAIDSYIPTPQREIDKPLLMSVEDVFSITGRSTVATGRVERGTVKVGDEVEIVGLKPTRKSVVTGVEMFRKLLDQAQAGDNIGTLLRGVDKQKSSVVWFWLNRFNHTSSQVTANVYVLNKDEGGRHTPFFPGYRPQFYFRTADVTGSIKLKDGVEMIMPGDNAELEVELIAPIAMKELHFAIREGSRTVGAGVVTSIIE